MGSSFKQLAIGLAAIYTGGWAATAMKLTGFAASAMTFAVSTAVTMGLSKALIKQPSMAAPLGLQKRTEMVKQPLSPREIVYGEVKKSGTILFMEATGNNQTLHMVISLASHEIQAIDKVYFNDEELSLSSSGNDTNGIARFNVTSPSKYSTESRFVNSTRPLVVSNYEDVTVNQSLPFGGNQTFNGKGIEKGITQVTLISDVAFSITTVDTLNIGGLQYGISTGGNSTGSGIRHTLTVTISRGLEKDVAATAIRFAGAFGATGRIQPYRTNENTPLPYLAGTTTTTDYALVAIHNFQNTTNLTVRVKKHLGADNQVADIDMVQDISGWTNEHKLSGIAYLYVSLKYDNDAFPNGIPNVSAEIKGKKLLDFRNGSTAYSANPALALYDYLSDTRFGLATPTANIDTTSFTTVANVCDEDISLAAGGTENRYECNGVIPLDVQPMNAIDQLAGSMLAALSYSNGKFNLSGGKYVSPTITLDEDDLRGGLTILTKQSRRDLFNTAKGVFTSPESNWQPTDYPMVTSSTFTEADGETIFGQIDLPFTTSSTMAQRIAKVTLFKNRQQIIVQIPCKFTAFKLQVGDTVNITNARMGWSSKVFQVADWTFSCKSQDFGIDLVLQETSADVWNWSAEETVFELDNTNLPTFETTSPPSLIVSDLMKSYSGIISTVITIECSSSSGTTNEFEVSYRNTATDIEFTSLGKSRNNKFEVLNAEDGMVYEIIARSINAFNVASEFTSVAHEVIGKTAIPSNVADLSVNVVNNLAVCSWTANEELDLSHYIIRHTPETSSPTYAGASIVANYISKATNQISLPAQTGTYMIKAVDVLGLASETSTKIAIIRNQIADDFNAVATATESTGFAGTKDGLEVVARDGVNYLQIVLGELFDAHTGNFDSAAGNFDDGGEVQSNVSGIYDFNANPIDLGAIYNSYVTTSMTSTRFNASSLFDSFEGLFDTKEGNFDGSYTEQDDVNVKIQISTSNDNSTYTSYQDYILGNYKARYIKLRVKLDTTNFASTPAISALSAVIDMPDRTFALDEIASGTASGGKAVTFTPAFKALQALAISADNLATGDFYVITSKSATGFTIKFSNSGGTVVDRTFGYVAKGFGYLESS